MASLGAAPVGWAMYLVATKTVAGIHDERLPSMVLLTHIQALIDTKVLYLQNGEQRGKPGQEIFSLWCQAQLG